MIPALEEVGRLFEIGEYFVPEMLVSAKAMSGSMEILRPLIAETGAKPIGTFVMGTVKGDIHDIGKNLCNIMLEGAGFEIIDLGVKCEVIEKSGSWYSYGPERIGQGREKTRQFLKDNPDIRDEIELEIRKRSGLLSDVLLTEGGGPAEEAEAG